MLIHIENDPLGECGALWQVKEKLSQDFIFLNGDLIFSIDFKNYFIFIKNFIKIDSCYSYK